MRYHSLLFFCSVSSAGMLSLQALPVSAADVYDLHDEMTEVQGFYLYPGSGGTAILDGVKSDLAGSVVIPDSFTYTTIVNNQTTKKTLKITYINKGAFAGCKNLEQVTIPASVTRIGEGAFANCPALKAVILPKDSSGISMGSDLFEGSDQVRLYGPYNEVPDWLGSYKSLFAGKLASMGSWKQSDNGKWWFSYYDGSWPKDKWAKIDGTWYLFDANGYRQTGWIKDAGKWYYLQEDGSMAQSVWIGGNYVDASGVFVPNAWKKASNGKWWYCFGDGTYPKNAWANIDKKKYLFDADGYMLTGWVHLGEGWYHLASDGALDRDQMVGSYYVNADGLWVQDAWENLDGHWYYRYADGTLAKDGLKEIKGHTYCFDKQGVMQTGWKKEADGWRYFRSSGEMAKDCTIEGYTIDADGLWKQ